MKGKIFQRLVTLVCVSAFAALGSACSLDDVFNKKWQEDHNLREHVHTIEYRPAVEATCKENGHAEYWVCTDCEKMFSDAEGNYEITYSIQTPKAPHALEYREGKKEGCLIYEYGEKARYTCTFCGANFEDAEGTVGISDIKIYPTGSHELTYDPGKLKSCEEDGIKAHYHCSKCNRDYEDKNGRFEITDLILPAGHIFDTRWSSDANEHWHEALCTHTEAIVKEAHTFENGACTVCQYHVPSEGLIYELNADGETAKLTGVGSCTDTKVYIASTFEGKPVTEIAGSAFADRSDLKSVSMPKSIQKIGYAAFNGCSSMTSAVISSDTVEIGSYAFSGCTNLKYVNFSNKLQKIGSSAFYGCTALTAVSLPNSVTFIGDSAFAGCTAVETVAAGGVASIGTAAFRGCTGLTDITINGAEVSIGAQAFEFCEALSSLTLNGVKSIGTQAFNGCKQLTQVVIPDSVISVGEKAFYGCTELATLSIGSGVETIGNYAFAECGKLATVTIAKNSQMKSIGDYAFSQCALLSQFIFPMGLKSIGSYAFEGCAMLLRADIPWTVDTIGRYAFRNSKLDIYTGADSKPAGWNDFWSSCHKVYWGGYVDRES